MPRKRIANLHGLDGNHGGWSSLKWRRADDGSSVTVKATEVLLLRALGLPEDPTDTERANSIREVRTRLSNNLTNLLPAGGALLSTARPACSADFSDAGIGVNPFSVSVRLDGKLLSLASASATGFAWQPPIDLAQGAHTLQVLVSDYFNQQLVALP